MRPFNEFGVVGAHHVLAVERRDEVANAELCILDAAIGDPGIVDAGAQAADITINLEAPVIADIECRIDAQTTDVRVVRKGNAVALDRNRIEMQTPADVQLEDAGFKRETISPQIDVRVLRREKF